MNAWADAILHGGKLVAHGSEGINGLMLSNAMHLSAFLGKEVSLPIDEELYYKNYFGYVDISEYDINGFTYILDDYNVAEIVSWVGNEVILKGKKNGSCKLIISHEKSTYTREVLVIVNNQQSDAIDSSCYITTSQNYIRTKVGAEGTLVNVSLKGGEIGDESNFIWTIQHTTIDGTENKGKKNGIETL